MNRTHLAIFTAVALAFTAAAAGAVEIPAATTTGATQVQAPPAIAPANGHPVHPPEFVPLKLGARGHIVRDLQRELRRRGLRVRIDGTFGPGTRAAVTRLQRRLGLRPTGIAGRTLLRRLGIQTVTAAAAPATATVPFARYLRAFPVLTGYSYFDSWGAPRSQGGHEGTDIMAPRRTPLLAVTDATIEQLSRVESGLGGIRVWLRDAEGNAYYYAHMEAIVASLDAGERVTAGQLLGSVGNSGDARGGPTHVHFEIHPGGGAAVNPYRELRAVDPAPPR